MRKFELLFGAMLLVLVIACTKNEVKEPYVEKIPENDTVINIDTCVRDTCYTCTINKAYGEIYNKLVRAYTENNDQLAEEALLLLANEYVADTEIHDSLKLVYDVFKEFYSPWDLRRIADSEFGDQIFEGIGTYIMQNSLRYDFYFKDRGDNTTYTVENFNPTINNSDIQQIEFNDDLKSMLDCFLGTGYVVTENDTIESLPFTVEEIFDRYYYLNKFIRFFPNHWHLSFSYITEPFVYQMSFNKTKDSAQVHYALGYQGGEAILVRDDDNWNVVDYYMTWIQK